MIPSQTAALTRAGVNALGGAFLECPKTLRHARALGLTGWASYVAGRGGALGDTRVEAVAAALGLIAPDAVREGWESAGKILPPSEVATEMLSECCRWGNEKLDDMPGIARLVMLAETAAHHADAGGMPLLAAWRAMPGSARASRQECGQSVPRDSYGARAAVALHLLREHRAGALLLGVRASGLTAMEALIAGPEGEASAVAFGWQPPYPEILPLLRRRVWADAVADRVAGQAFAILTGPERGEIVSLINAATRHAGLAQDA